MLTESKKNYSGIIFGQEGNILTKPKHDIKGLAIKKVNTNRKVREYYTDMILNDILLADEISIPTVFKHYNEFKNIIERSFLNGEISYSIPGKINPINTYEEPLRQQTVRGTLLWNELYPEDTINPPDKINYLKLKVPHEKDEYAFDVLCDIIDKDDEISNKEKERVKSVIKELVYDDDSFAHYGLSVICFPKKIKKIPKWLSSIIALDEMIEANLKPGYKILKSLNSKVLSYQVGDSKGETISNILTI